MTSSKPHLMLGRLLVALAVFYAISAVAVFAGDRQERPQPVAIAAQGQIQGQLQAQQQKQRSNARASIVQGNTYAAPDAPAVFSGTHPCVRGVSGGVGIIPGDFLSQITGASAGATYTDRECTIRQEALVLAGLGKKNLALLHMATHDRSVRCTLYTQGAISIPDGGDTGCGAKRDFAKLRGAVTAGTKAPSPIPPAACRRDGRTLYVTPRQGIDRETAVAFCKAQ